MGDQLMQRFAAVWPHGNVALAEGFETTWYVNLRPNHYVMLNTEHTESDMDADHLAAVLRREIVKMGRVVNLFQDRHGSRVTQHEFKAHGSNWLGEIWPDELTAVMTVFCEIQEAKAQEGRENEPRTD
jgi:hypothetical protein